MGAPAAALAAPDPAAEALFAAIAQSPWNSRAFRLPDWHRKYPTMLTREEMRMLAWIARNATVPGAIADLGCFLGGSTVSLAWGAKEAALPRRIRSFDRFRVDEANKFRFLYSRGHGYMAGEDALPLFRHFTRPFGSTVEAVPGDIQAQSWRHGPIAVLFIDLAKTRGINDHILKTFFPHLVPGSIVVQQDFLYIRNPWLYPTMFKLRGAIEMLGHTEHHSVIFGVRRVPDAAALRACLAANTTRAETVAAIEHFRTRFHRVRQLEMIDAVMASYLAAPDADAGWNIPNAAGIRDLEDDD
jgi:hypothetical protein